MVMIQNKEKNIVMAKILQFPINDEKLTRIEALALHGRSVRSQINGFRRIDKAYVSALARKGTPLNVAMHQADLLITLIKYRLAELEQEATMIKKPTVWLPEDDSDDVYHSRTVDFR